MNREQRRAEEKKVSKSGKTTVDITLNRTIIPDGAQRRYTITAKETYKGKTDESVVGLIVVVEPFIYKGGDKKKDDNPEIVGIDGTECLIMDINVFPQYRKNGVGKFAVDGLKKYYDRMITGAQSEEGKSLMLRCGFKITEQGQLVWAKDSKELKEKDEK